MNLLLFGGTGYLGEAITKKLLEGNHSVTLFVRKLPTLPVPKVNYVVGDINKIQDLKTEFENLNIEGIIYSIGLLKEDSKGDFLNAHYYWVDKTVLLGELLKIKRYVLISANGVSKSGTPYQRSKLLGEETLKGSKLCYTIFRPSIICGASTKYHFLNIVTQLIKFPLIPLIGNGEFLLSPVDREQLGEIIKKSLKNSLTENKIFHVVGSKNYSFKEIIIITGNHFNKKVRLVRVPIYLIRLVSTIFGFLSFFPITPSMLQMLLEGNTSNDKKIWEILNLKPKPLEDIIRGY